MATFGTTYQTTGMVEDIKDLVEVISPQETPVYSMLGRGTVHNTLHEWLTLTLPTSTGNKTK